MSVRSAPVRGSKGVKNKPKYSKQSQGGKVRKLINDAGRLINDVVAAPVAIGSTRKTSVPSMSVRNGVTTVAHREYIADIASTEDYLPRSYSVNPGLTALFPWLSSIARGFEQYQFTKLNFQYLPVCATDQGGSVMLSCDPDSSDVVPRNKVEFLTQKGAQSSNVWKGTESVTAIRDISQQLFRYVRSGTYEGDIKTYDAGRLHVATQGGTDDVPIGELWVDYVCHLKTPTPTLGNVGSVYINGAQGANPLGDAAWTPDMKYGNVPADRWTATRLRFTCDWKGLVMIQFIGDAYTAIAQTKYSGTGTMDTWQVCLSAKAEGGGDYALLMAYADVYAGDIFTISCTSGVSTAPGTAFRFVETSLRDMPKLFA